MHMLYSRRRAVLNSICRRGRVYRVGACVCNSDRNVHCTFCPGHFVFPQSILRANFRTVPDERFALRIWPSEYFIHVVILGACFTWSPKYIIDNTERLSYNKCIMHRGRRPVLRFSSQSSNSTKQRWISFYLLDRLQGNMLVTCDLYLFPPPIQYK
jgi:hypothetical protein